MGYFRILDFELKLSASGTLAYNVTLALLSGKKKWVRDEKRGPVLKDKSVTFTCF